MLLTAIQIQAASEFKRVLADKALAARDKIVLLVLANKSDLPQARAPCAAA
jgi:hypothetical protein